MHIKVDRQIDTFVNRFDHQYELHGTITEEAIYSVLKMLHLSEVQLVDFLSIKASIACLNISRRN